MNTHADKTQENKIQSVANTVAQKQSGGESTFQFVDNRPEAVAQRKLQEMANNNPRAMQLKAFQDMANAFGSKQQPIQRKLNFQSGAEYLDNSQNTIDNVPFNRVQNKAKALYDVAELNFKNEKPKVGAAAFSPDSPFIMGGDVKIEPLSSEQLENKSYDYNDRLVEVTHETHHAIDHIEGLDISSEADYENKVISEFRTFAVQSAVSHKLEKGGKNVSMKYKEMQKSYDPDIVFASDSSSDGFAKGNFMFILIRFYIKIYTKADQESDQATSKFIEEYKGELERAIDMYKSLKNDNEGEHDYITSTEEYEEEGETIDHGDVQITEILKKQRQVRKNIR